LNRIANKNGDGGSTECLFGSTIIEHAAPHILLFHGSSDFILLF
jgi:hypothetical protein